MKNILVIVLLVSVSIITILTGCSENKSETLSNEVGEKEHSEQIEIKTIWTDSLVFLMGRVV